LSLWPSAFSGHPAPAGGGAAPFERTCATRAQGPPGGPGPPYGSQDVRFDRLFFIELENLTGAAPLAIYDRLLAGHALIAWVGLGDGPYDTWQSREGTTINVNFNGHTAYCAASTATGRSPYPPPSRAPPRRGRARSSSPWQLLRRRALSR